MKNIKSKFVLLSIVLLTTLTACEDVFVDLSKIEIHKPGVWLHWDSDVANNRGVGYENGGVFNVAARWGAGQLSDYEGMYIAKIQYAIHDDGYTQIVAKLWSGAGASNLLWEQDVTANTKIGWNVVVLDVPIALDVNDEIWVGYTITQTAGMYPMGVDDGPAIPWYGDLVSYNEEPWSPLSSGNSNFNWKIQMYVEGSIIPTESFTDSRDGQIYKSVDIGSQTWMAENLNYETPNSWWYDNNSGSGDIYGRLYTWGKALTSCPNGWHLPSDDEWKTLEMALGMSQSEADVEDWRGTDEGQKMKSTNGWYNNGNGTNSSGFNSLPGGYRYSNGSFEDLGSTGSWWSSSESSGTCAWSRYLVYDRDQVYRDDDGYKTNGFSVRCVKD